MVVKMKLGTVLLYSNFIFTIDPTPRGLLLFSSPPLVGLLFFPKSIPLVGLVTPLTHHLNPRLFSQFNPNGIGLIWERHWGWFGEKDTKPTNGIDLGKTLGADLGKKDLVGPPEVGNLFQENYINRVSFEFWQLRDICNILLVPTLDNSRHSSFLSPAMAG